ncbi:MAG: hypothetical protein ACOYNB_00450 [Aquabacterium sp.]|uniref:hypothetical protein n=1 Tax=Aquabacterium sp. TaxID=1872578 RepID=UPI003BE07E13
MSLSAASFLTRMGLALAAATTLMAGTAQATTNVGVSVSVNQPGFYGRVDIGDTQPVLVYPQPVIIRQQPYGMQQRPIYLRVPPGHSKNWARYCNHYNACGQPVYFVRDMPPPAGRYDEHRHGGWEDDRRGPPGHGHGHGGRH